jgi:hypothetical protein
MRRMHGCPKCNHFSAATRYMWWIEGGHSCQRLVDGRQTAIDHLNTCRVANQDKPWAYNNAYIQAIHPVHSSMAWISILLIFGHNRLQKCGSPEQIF